MYNTIKNIILELNIEGVTFYEDALGTILVEDIFPEFLAEVDNALSTYERRIEKDRAGNYTIFIEARPTLDIDTEGKTEWIVERVFCGERKVIGAVYTEKTMHLCNSQLDGIWNLANFDCSQPKPYRANTKGIFNGSLAFNSNGLDYIPVKTLCDTDKGMDYIYIGVVNQDIFIRKTGHLLGYYIKADKINKKDEWLYGTVEDWKKANK